MATNNIIEHPALAKVEIPEGWERITDGDAEPGDLILVGGENEPKFMPWHSNDGIGCVTTPAGKTRVGDKLVHYRCVLLREKGIKYRYGYLMCPDKNDPQVSSLTEALEKARQMSSDDRDHPVAVWDKDDKTLRLFAAAEEFITI